jgi:hypothetical protein
MNQARARLKVEETYLDRLKLSGGRKMAKRLDRKGETGAWLLAIPNCFDGMELSGEEFQDNLAICYGLCPRGLPEWTAVSCRWVKLQPGKTFMC